MSEYQLYDFRAIDKPLTSGQMKELRRYSTRAEITPTSFKNEYNYGSFKGSETEWMEKYFDAHVYVSNWGSSTLVLRLPLGMLDDERLSEFVNDESFTWRQTESHLILCWSRTEEETYDDEYEDEGWMARLLPIRDELNRGDMRSLYIGWLAGIYESEPIGDDPEEVEFDLVEPPVPDGLKNLTESQQALAEFMSVDEDLLSAAAAASADISSAPSSAVAEQWVESLTHREMRTHLQRLVIEGGNEIQMRLTSQFHRWCAENQPAKSSNAASRRSANTLYKMADERKQVRTARKRAAEEKARTARLTVMVPRIPTMWETAQQLAATKKSSAYNQVTDLLVQIREAAEFAGEGSQFEVDLDDFLAIHTSKALRDRLSGKGMKVH